MEAKNVFLFVIIIVLLYIVIKYVVKDVNTLSGLVSAQTMQKIEASSLASSSSAGATSNYTYSIWFYIDDWNVKYGDPKVIFGRMASEIDKNQPCPLVTLAPLENNLIVSLAIYPGMDSAPIDTTTATTTTATTDNATITSTDVSSSDSESISIHRCMVANVPIQKWVNVLISTYGRSLDIYIDGKLVRTCVLPGVARIESSTPVYITPNGGFSGWTAKFQYWPESCDPQKAWNIYKAGYGASMLAGLLGKYTIKLSLMEGDTEDSSFSI
jgi:hypothetical protein